MIRFDSSFILAGGQEPRSSASASLRLHTYGQCHHFSYSLKWVQYNSVEQFTHNVKKIKSAVHENCDVDGMCKQECIPVGCVLTAG